MGAEFKPVGDFKAMDIANLTEKPETEKKPAEPLADKQIDAKKTTAETQIDAYFKSLNLNDDKQLENGAKQLQGKFKKELADKIEAIQKQYRAEVQKMGAIEVNVDDLRTQTDQLIQEITERIDTEEELKPLVEHEAQQIDIGKGDKSAKLKALSDHINGILGNPALSKTLAENLLPSISDLKEETPDKLKARIEEQLTPAVIQRTLEKMAREYPDFKATTERLSYMRNALKQITIVDEKTGNTFSLHDFMKPEMREPAAQALARRFHVVSGSNHQPLLFDLTTNEYGSQKKFAETIKSIVTTGMADEFKQTNSDLDAKSKERPDIDDLLGNGLFDTDVSSLKDMSEAEKVAMTQLAEGLTSYQSALKEVRQQIQEATQRAEAAKDLRVQPASENQEATSTAESMRALQSKIIAGEVPAEIKGINIAQIIVYILNAWKTGDYETALEITNDAMSGRAYNPDVVRATYKEQLKARPPADLLKAFFDPKGAEFKVAVPELAQDKSNQDAVDAAKEKNVMLTKYRNREVKNAVRELLAANLDGGKLTDLEARDAKTLYIDWEKGNEKGVITLDLGMNGVTINGEAFNTMDDLKKFMVPTKERKETQPTEKWKDFIKNDKAVASGEYNTLNVTDGGPKIHEILNIQKIKEAVDNKQIIGIKIQKGDTIISARIGTLGNDLTLVYRPEGAKNDKRISINKGDKIIIEQGGH